MILARAALLSALLLTTACGGSSPPANDGGGGAGTGGSDGGAPAEVGHGGCATVQASCDIQGTTCTDYGPEEASVLAATQQACLTAKGIWSTTACDTTATVGGCKTESADTCAVNWEFSPLTQSAGQKACDKRGAGNTFVTP